MCSNIFACTNGTYIEADSKLSAIATFLDELEGDPAAPALLLTMVDQIRSIVADGIDADAPRQLDSAALRRCLRVLRDSIAGLARDRSPSETAWQKVRRDHHRCRTEFTRFARQLCTCGRSQHNTLAAVA